MLLTVVARVCPTYRDVMANNARNNIQESLEDLGPDSVYAPGAPVNPDIEAREHPNCSGLPGWRFTLGTGHQSRAVAGPWGSMSRVTGQFSPTIETRESVPLLNDHGQGTGRRIWHVHQKTLAIRSNLEIRFRRYREQRPRFGGLDGIGPSFRLTTITLLSGD